MVHLGNNIAKLRGFRRLPQKDVAKKIKMTQQDYSKLENTAEIDDDLLERIAAALDFPVQAIKEMDAHSVINFNQEGGHANGTSFYQYLPNEKMNEVCDRILKQNEEIIELLKRKKA